MICSSKVTLRTDAFGGRRQWDFTDYKPDDRSTSYSTRAIRSMTAPSQDGGTPTPRKSSVVVQSMSSKKLQGKRNRKGKTSRKLQGVLLDEVDISALSFVISPASISMNNVIPRKAEMVNNCKRSSRSYKNEPSCSRSSIPELSIASSQP